MVAVLEFEADEQLAKQAVIGTDANHITDWRSAVATLVATAIDERKTTGGPTAQPTVFPRRLLIGQTRPTLGTDGVVLMGQRFVTDFTKTRQCQIQ